jgi:hypothetical protein
MRIDALQPSVRIIASTGALASVVPVAKPRLTTDSLALASRTSAVPAVAMALTKPDCGCTIAERLQLADEADKAGPDYFRIAKEHYSKATAAATTATDLYAIGDHAATRGYTDHAKIAREKAITADLTAAQTLEARLATAAKADGFGKPYFDFAKRSYNEATTKATTAADFYAIGDHAATRGYTAHARVAREKAIAAELAGSDTTEARLAAAAKADGFGKPFFDAAKRCYNEAITKASDRQELTRIAQHAEALGYTAHAKVARAKALSC